MEKEKLTSSENKILQTLMALKNPKYIRIKDLAKKSGMWQGNVSRYVSQLEKKGLVIKFHLNGFIYVEITLDNFANV
jgi:DNA-binding MarR family transcriptional regulator